LVLFADLLLLLMYLLFVAREKENRQRAALAECGRHEWGGVMMFVARALAGGSGDAVQVFPRAPVRRFSSILKLAVIARHSSKLPGPVNSCCYLCRIDYVTGRVFAGGEES
jgi:hypothetical protein